MAEKVSGIYSITNTVNGKRYYGSSVNVWGRKRQHWSDLQKRKHKNPHLQAAWNLYGEAAFVFALMEEAPVKNLLVVEQSYLDANRDGYNVAEYAESAALGVKWSAEARAKFSRLRKGTRLSDEHKKALSVANKGRRKSDAERAAMSERMKGSVVGNKAKEKIAAKVTSLWKDERYREKVIAAQTIGKNTKQAKRNYSAASRRKWADPEFAGMMSDSMKSRWSDPAYRAKMLEVRRIQGQKLREKNQTVKEKDRALS